MHRTATTPNTLKNICARAARLACVLAVMDAMKAVMVFAEKELGMKECITAYAAVNKASANVLHKLGFKDESKISYECNGGDIVTDGIMCRYNSK